MSKRLNLKRRNLIEEHLASQWSVRRIAAVLCVVASSVLREVSRNGGAAGYRAAVAQLCKGSIFKFSKLHGAVI